MNELSYNVPGLLFPAISLLMLAYTNRFLGLATIARHLVEQHEEIPDPSVYFQIQNLRVRIQLIRQSQAMGILSLTFCTVSLFLLFIGVETIAQMAFGMALLLMLASLVLSLKETYLSARALDRALGAVANKSN